MGKRRRRRRRAGDEVIGTQYPEPTQQGEDYWRVLEAFARIGTEQPKENA